MSDIAIQVEGLGKMYRIGHQTARYRTIRESIVDWVMTPFQRAGRVLRGRATAADLSETIWALKDVSINVERGEVVGIIGRNGAGKTTLLKILSRITEPTVGDAWIHGRVGSLLEVGTGFHPELTGRENIFLNGAILGMKRSEIEQKYDEMVEFSGIEKFIDTPVKHYSSGMYVRLAFSVAAHLEPEILLVDEVLAVGDAAFQKKCLGKMEDVARGGRTVLFVSHNMSAVRSLCTKTAWIDDGKLQQFGETQEVIDRYLASSHVSMDVAERHFPEDTNKEFQLLGFSLTNKEGLIKRLFDCDEPVILDMSCRVNKEIPGLYGYLSISKLDGTVVMVSDSFDSGQNSLDELPLGMHSLRIEIPERTLGPGEYSVYLNFTSRGGVGGFNIDSPGIVGSFRLEDHTTSRGNSRPGFFSTKLTWQIKQAIE